MNQQIVGVIDWNPGSVFAEKSRQFVVDHKTEAEKRAAIESDGAVVLDGWKNGSDIGITFQAGEIVKNHRAR